MRKRRNNIGIYKHSTITKLKISQSNTGELSSQWKGDSAKYQALHSWIRLHYGKANKCENINCQNESKEYQWALRLGRNYSRNIKDYIQLCRSCHRKMDMTNETRRKISQSLRKFFYCTVDKCKNSYLAKGLCRLHYLRMYRLKLKGS